MTNKIKAGDNITIEGLNINSKGEMFFNNESKIKKVKRNLGLSKPSKLTVIEVLK